MRAGAGALASVQGRQPPGQLALSDHPHPLDRRTQKEQDALKAAKDRGEPVGVGDQAWGAWGPRALTWFLHKTGEIRYALPRAALYPISFKDRRLLVRPDVDMSPYLTPETLSIHFFYPRVPEH